MNRRTSVKARLLISLFVVLPLVWLVACVAAAVALYNEVNQLNDTQMSQLARRLLSVPPEYTRKNKRKAAAPLAALIDGEQSGAAQEGYMSFAVWDKYGNLVLADRGSRFLHHIPPDSGFRTIELPREPPRGRHGKAFSAFEKDGREPPGRADKKREKENERTGAWQNAPRHPREIRRARFWRVLYLHEPRNGGTVAVAQNMHARFGMVKAAVTAQILPWLIALPLMMALLWFSVGRALRPIGDLTRELSRRSPQDERELNENIPEEIRPLAVTLNRLFRQINETIARERRFTADAAHELRSPLAALKVQAEVLAMADNDEERRQIIGHINQGIDRAGRLIEQLLTLARIDPLEHTAEENIDWQKTAEKVLQDIRPAAEKKHIALVQETGDDNTLPLRGDNLLIGLMLRNLLDNAVRYSPPHSEVHLILQPDAVIVQDNGKGLPEDVLARVCERFYRPPGQSQSGSGLGLSIVERIAALHRLELTLSNRPQGGLEARICRIGTKKAA